MTTAQFWFDPICPWTYVTFRWLDAVRQVRPVVIEPRLLSLYYLNQGRDGVSHGEAHRASLNLERFLAWVRHEAGPDVMLKAYDFMGRSLFLEGDAADDELVSETAATVGLDQVAAGAAALDASWDEAILADHYAAMSLVGDDVGSPVIALGDGPAFFGPVLSRPLTGQAAGQVWDGCVALASQPAFFELKRSRGPAVKIAFE
ncbi:MAG: hypothetical protein LBJ62_02310 [Bifidobacteriaceae bacterium]|jgi:2-hydroxychromene-2-carboxylate isomerase|nr:hypothetical protein [Bifidobacteriaceae bacterium]